MQKPTRRPTRRSTTGLRLRALFESGLMSLMLALGIVMAATATGHAALPNIVVILADDLGWGDVGFNGGAQIQTPNMDALARSGVIFSAGYAPSAVCSPSRAGLMTGRYPQRFGLENNPPAGVSLGLSLGETTIAQVLGAAGYDTAIIGKWHLGGARGYKPNERGFDDFYGFLPSTSAYLGGVTLWRNEQREIETRYLTTAFGAEAADFIDAHSTRPFFLYLPFNAPHVPLQAPAAYLKRYSSITNSNRRTYAAMVSALDDAVGVVADALKRNRIDRNTLLIFASDNGGAEWKGADNGPLRGGKSELYEGGVRVPMFVRWPGVIPGGGTYTKPVISLDVLPTVAAAAGAQTPPHVDGVNLLPYLLGTRKGSPHRTLFWRVNGGQSIEQSAVLTYPMKLLEQRTSSVISDLSTDLGESHPLHPQDLLDEMRSEYQRWVSQTIRPLW